MSIPENSLGASFRRQGYCVLRGNKELRHQVVSIKHRYERDYASRFTADPEYNRNLIKRLGDDPAVARLFAAGEIQKAAVEIGLKDPVFCGPIVTHYTSHDMTGQSFGLPYHQDWPSMASSDNSAIFWINLEVSGPEAHGLEIVPGAHKQGLLEGTQEAGGYILPDQNFDNCVVPAAEIGDVIIMSPYVPHRTYVNPDFKGYKLSLSRRMDDLTCPIWPSRKYANAYHNAVDRDLFRKWL